MRLGRFAFAAFVSMGGLALADTDDTLLVTGEGVNVRAAPSLEGRIVMRVNRNRQVIEIERSGDWVRAEIADTGGREGWIHGSLLAPAADEPRGEPEQAAEVEAVSTTESATTLPAAGVSQPAEPVPTEETAAPDVAAVPQGSDPFAPEPAAGPADTSLERFRSNVTYLNQRAQQVAGVSLFTEVEPGAAGVIQVGTTEAWATVPPAGQQSYLNTLFDRWVAAHDGAPDLVVRILDDQGTVVLEKAGP